MKNNLVILALLVSSSLVGFAAASAEHESLTPPIPRKTESKQTLQSMISPYLADCDRRISRVWAGQNYQGSEFSCEFDFANNKQLRNLKIKRSSGSKDTDRAAIECVQKAQIRPFPNVLQNPVISVLFLDSKKENNRIRVKTRLKDESIHNELTGRQPETVGN